MNRTDSVNWQPYSPARFEGKLCYHLCTTDSELPLRMVIEGYTEPNYETMTYNYYWCCNQIGVRAAVNDGLSHILFVTRYKGKNRQYAERCFIVGYYEIGWTDTVGNRTVIRPKKLSFTRIEDAYEITPERWKRINPDGKSYQPESLRYATQRLKGSLFEEIVTHLDAHDATADYLFEVARLKAETNPFEVSPAGRIFIINVGANTDHRQQSPLFEDGSFEFVPIPASSDDGCTFANLRQFNAPDRPLIDQLQSLNISPTTQIHNDPEFATFTFGDSPIVKPGLKPMTKGDFLFFLVRLVPYRNKQYKNQEGIFAFIGFLEIEEVIPLPSDSTIEPLLTSPAFNRNAHVMRWFNDRVPYDDGYVVYKGSINSRRFRKSIRLDRAFVEDIPLLTAAGAPWNWETNTELAVINSHTRSARLHIDPNANSEGAARFWSRIFASQGWS